MDEPRLRKFFHFTPADLLANCRGELSEAQQKRLEQQAKAEQAAARSSAVILFVVAAMGLAIGVTIGSIAPSLIGRILMWLFMGILWPVVWGGKAVQILLAARRLQTPRLHQISGPAQIVQHRDEFVLQVGEQAFDLDGRPSGAILDGDPYTVYFLEATAEILSVEPTRPN